MKRSQAKNKDGVEYIVRVDLVRNTLSQWIWLGVHFLGGFGKEYRVSVDLVSCTRLVLIW